MNRSENRQLIRDTMKPILKTNLLIIAISLVIMGCDRKRSCSDFIPDDSQLDWSGYNTVRDFEDFFRYPEAVKKHRGDTVGICGWIIWEDVNYFYHQQPPYVLPGENGSVCISDDSTGRFNFPLTELFNGDDDDTIPRALWHKKIYVKGTISYVEEDVQEIGCNAGCMFYIFQVDSIPNETK